MTSLVRHFEWTFSTRIRQRACLNCHQLTAGYVTALGTGVRKPLCSSCFFGALKESGARLFPMVASSHFPARKEMEQLRLC